MDRDRVPPQSPLAAPSPSPSPGRLAARGHLFRAYFIAVTGLLSIAALLLSLLPALGFSSGASYAAFGLAGASGALGLAAWGLVLLGQGRAGSAPGGWRGAVVWIAFPIAAVSLLAMIPILLFALFPELMMTLGSPDRLKIDRPEEHRPGTIEIEFPRLMSEERINLELEGFPVPSGYFDSHPASARWRRAAWGQPRSYLFLDLEALRRDLALPEIHWLGINLLLGQPPMLDGAGERFQPQRIDLPPGK